MLTLEARVVAVRHMSLHGEDTNIQLIVSLPLPRTTTADAVAVALVQHPAVCVWLPVNNSKVAVIALTRSVAAKWRCMTSSGDSACKSTKHN